MINGASPVVYDSIATICWTVYMEMVLLHVKTQQKHGIRGHSGDFCQTLRRFFTRSWQTEESPPLHDPVITGRPVQLRAKYMLPNTGSRTLHRNKSSRCYAIVGYDRMVVNTSLASETAGVEGRWTTDSEVISLVTEHAV